MCMLPLSSQPRGKNEAQIVFTDLLFSQKSTKLLYNAVFVAILVRGTLHSLPALYACKLYNIKYDLFMTAINIQSLKYY